MKKTIHMLFLSLLIGLLSACSTTQKTTNSARSATEQLLISEAIARSLSKSDAVLPMLKGSIIKLDVTGLTSDKDMVKVLVAGWLGSLGYTVQDSPEKATHRINLIVDSLGTESGTTFFGVPPVRSSFIPFSLPELAIFKTEQQAGYARFHLDIFDMPSGQFIASSSPFVADTFYNSYTVLFAIGFNKTDLHFHPRLRTEIEVPRPFR